MPTVQLAYNSATSESTRTSPFFANYSYEPNIVKNTRGTTNNPIATVATTEIKSLHNTLKQELSFVNERITYYANKQRVKGLPLEEGDTVYLLQRNIKTKRLSNKLDYKRTRLF